MPDGGSLTIETADVELDMGYARAHPGVTAELHASLIFSDTGKGWIRKLYRSGVLR